MTPKLSVYNTRIFLSAAALSAVTGCKATDAVAVSLTSNTSQSLTVPAGRQFTITLGTVGPGSYAAPPAISSSAVRYVTVSDAEPKVPAGARQRFVFQADGPGTAVIVFTHDYSSSIVQDTVLVH